MIKKSIASILAVLILINSFGCYKSMLLKEEDEIRSYLNKKSSINYLTTQDSERYSFKDYRYKYEFVNDTLFGWAKRISANPWQKYESVKLSVTEIDSLEIEEKNTAVIIAVSVVLVSGFVIFVISTIRPTIR